MQINFLLYIIMQIPSVKWKWSEVEDPMDCSLPGSSVHGTFQARILEWVAISFSRVLVNKKMKFQPRPKSFFLPVSYIEVLK